MLIRIGDQKRESVEQHVELLKNKIVDVESHEADTFLTIVDTLSSVIFALPHKAGIYAALIASIAQTNQEMAVDLT